MSTVAKIASICFLGSALLASSLSPAYALRMPEDAGASPTGQQAVSAYSDNEQTDTSAASILSPGEIKHIEWCAARYTLGYDAVSDTYAGAGGTRLQCRSPR